MEAENEEQEVVEEEEEKAYIIKIEGYDMQCQAAGKRGRPCQWTWTPRLPGAEPVKCPRCQSREWRGAPVDKGEEKPYKIPVTYIQLECQERGCGNVWTPQNLDRLPLKCPQCGSWDWKGDDE